MTMNSYSVTLKSLPLFRTPQLHPRPKRSLPFPAYRMTPPPPHASTQRISYFSEQAGNNFANDPRTWRPPINTSSRGGDDKHEEDDDYENEDDPSFDLLVRFVHNLFKKVSRRARKAVRSLLPVSISADLVGFSVNGVLMLASLWTMKGFLEVVYTLGSAVFVSILLIRGIWSLFSYFRIQKVNGHDEEQHAWNRPQPVT